MISAYCTRNYLFLMAFYKKIIPITNRHKHGVMRYVLAFRYAGLVGECSNKVDTIYHQTHGIFENSVVSALTGCEMPGAYATYNA